MNSFHTGELDQHSIQQYFEQAIYVATYVAVNWIYLLGNPCSIKLLEAYATTYRANWLSSREEECPFALL